jgi:toxin HigB-1
LLTNNCHASRYSTVMIAEASYKDTASVFAGRSAKKIPSEIFERAEAKLAVLDQVESVQELRQPPSNRLH